RSSSSRGRTSRTSKLQRSASHSAHCGAPASLGCEFSTTSKASRGLPSAARRCALCRASDISAAAAIAAYHRTSPIPARITLAATPTLLRPQKKAAKPPSSSHTRGVPLLHIGGGSRVRSSGEFLLDAGGLAGAL